MLPENYHRDLLAFKHQLPATGGLIALDHGQKRIGMAISDNARRLALPQAILPSQWQQQQEYLAMRVSSDKLVGIVVGLPLNLSGNFTPSTQRASAFALRLAQSFPGLAILVYDERLTSMAARERINALAKPRVVVDAIAAQILLERVLEQLAFN